MVREAPVAKPSSMKGLERTGRRRRSHQDLERRTEKLNSAIRTWRGARRSEKLNSAIRTWRGAGRSGPGESRKVREVKLSHQDLERSRKVSRKVREVKLSHQDLETEGKHSAIRL